MSSKMITSFFGRKEIKVFEENIPGFFLYIVDFNGKSKMQVQCSFKGLYMIQAE